MGLTIRAAGLSCEDTYDCGYLTFGVFRQELASLYNAELGELYKTGLRRQLTNAEIRRYNELCNDDLDEFLWHSDHDGKLTWQQCRDVYKVIKDMHMDMIGHNYGVMKSYNMLEHWKNMFYHCWKRRVTMWFE